MPTIPIDGALLNRARDNAGATYADIAVRLGATTGADIDSIEKRLRRAIQTNKADKEFIDAVCEILGADFNLIRQDVFMAWSPPTYLEVRPRASPYTNDDWRDSPTMATLSVLKFEARQSGRIDSVRLRLPHCTDDYGWLYTTNIAPGPNGWLGPCSQITPPLVLDTGDVWSEEVMFAASQAPSWVETLEWLSQAHDPEITIEIANNHGVQLKRRLTFELNKFHEKRACWAKKKLGRVHSYVTLKLQEIPALCPKQDG